MMTSDVSVHPYRQGLQQGVLRCQRCRTCGTAQTGTRHACAACGGTTLDWVDTGGRGTVYALTSVHRAPGENFAALVPYTLVLVDLDEGVRVMAHGVPGLAIGDRVAAQAFVHAGRALARFHPLDAAAP